MLPSQLETRLGAQALGASGSGAHDVRAALWFPARRQRGKGLGEGKPPSLQCQDVALDPVEVGLVARRDHQMTAAAQPW